MFRINQHECQDGGVDASWIFCRSNVMSPPVCMSRILIISSMLKSAQMHEESPVAHWEKKRE